jgi:5-methylcytosine-specific restriction endonuclease McrA
MHENYKTLNTVSMEIPVPEIIILTEYDKIPERFVKFSKANLLIRDDYKCVYCGCTLDTDTATIIYTQHLRVERLRGIIVQYLAKNAIMIKAMNYQ